MILDGRTSFSLLEKSIPYEFREELLQEDVAKSVEQLVHILSVVSYLILGFLPLMGFCLQSDQRFFSSTNIIVWGQL